MRWFSRIRLRVFAILLAAGLAVVGVLNIIALPVLPVVGVAIITVAAVVNTVTHRLAAPTCLSCGADISEEPQGPHGRVCASCGAITSFPRA
ncbi:MAG: hypothetical protein AAF235_07180 [Planctomycetota bacterium]